MMTSASPMRRPWQYDWNHPLWHHPEGNNQASYDEAIDHAAFDHQETLWTVALFSGKAATKLLLRKDDEQGEYYWPPHFPKLCHVGFSVVLTGGNRNDRTSHENAGSHNENDTSTPTQLILCVLTEKIELFCYRSVDLLPDKKTQTDVVDKDLFGRWLLGDDLIRQVQRQFQPLQNPYFVMRLPHHPWYQLHRPPVHPVQTANFRDFLVVVQSNAQLVLVHLASRSIRHREQLPSLPTKLITTESYVYLVGDGATKVWEPTCTRVSTGATLNQAVLAAWRDIVITRIDGTMIGRNAWQQSRLQLLQQATLPSDLSTDRPTNCVTGPGFTILVQGRQAYFLCWQGATHGYWHALGRAEALVSPVVSHSTGSAAAKQPTLVLETSQSTPVDIVEEAIENLARESSLSDRERSARLLRRCSSWNQLKESNWNEPHRPILSLSNGRVLSARLPWEFNVAFPHVLGWLVEKGDFLTAASIALDLLGDARTLRLLRGVERDECLLDGVLIPVEAPGDVADPSVLTQLADMAVGCMVKGGHYMSGALMGLLERDKHYDSLRSSLLLVAAVSLSLSDIGTVNTTMGGECRREDHNGLNRLWLIECLMAIGVARDDTLTPIRLLNAAVPDELRGRRRTPALSTNFGVDLISTIVRTSTDCVDQLLEMPESMGGSKLRFWESLDGAAQQQYCLIDIDGVHPLLKHDDVRHWLLETLQSFLEEASSQDGDRMLPTTWLQQVVAACMVNGRVDIRDLSLNEHEEKVDFSEGEGSAAVNSYMAEASRLRLAFSKADGLDFNVVIPCMLLLNHYQLDWSPQSRFLTSDVLSAVCYWAGRPTATCFAIFDSQSLMRQCALLNNIEAGSNLVGGQDGLVLQCCNVLIAKAGVSIDEAENAILFHVLPDSLNTRRDTFEIDESFLRLLWLLHEHVLSIRTYGDFDAPETRGRLDPVFAAKVILRTWWLLTQHNREATFWLVKWLRGRLDISPSSSTPSKHRLVCAALGRALLWPPESTTAPFSALACKMELPGAFAIEICQASVGLAESVPTEASSPARKIGSTPTHLNTSMDSSFESASSIFYD